jgi:hypothetical protein
MYRVRIYAEKVRSVIRDEDFFDRLEDTVPFIEGFYERYPEGVDREDENALMSIMVEKKEWRIIPVSRETKIVFGDS